MRRRRLSIQRVLLAITMEASCARNKINFIVHNISWFNTTDVKPLKYLNWDLSPSFVLGVDFFYSSIADEMAGNRSRGHCARITQICAPNSAKASKKFRGSSESQPRCSYHAWAVNDHELFQPVLFKSEEWERKKTVSACASPMLIISPSKMRSKNNSLPPHTTPTAIY